jgi:PDZ domain-containing protein
LIIGLVPAGPASRHGRIDELLAALVGRTGVDAVTVADAHAAEHLQANQSALVCVEVTGRSLTPVPLLDGPCLVVGPRFDPQRLVLAGGEVLVGLDGSARSGEVVPVALQWAALLGVGACLTTATPTKPRPLAAEELNDRLEASYVARAARQAERDGLRPSWDVLHGDPAAALLAYAERTGAPMLAVNSHGVHTAARSPFGKVPVSLIRHSTVPILLTQRRLAPRPDRPAPPPSRIQHRRPTVHPVGPLRRPRLPQLQLGQSSPPRPRPPARRVPAVATMVGTGLAVLALAFVPLPYESLSGDTLAAGDMVHAEEAIAVSPGRLLLVPIVQPRRVSAVEILRSRLSSRGEIRAVPGPQTERRNQQQGAVMMDEAARNATAVAARHLSLDPSTVTVDVDAHGVGGPSAGLAFALEIVDQLSPGGLTSGRLVAVTGGLDAEGRVVPVMGVTLKAQAAERAGADLLLVPAANEAEAIRAVDDLRVVPVSSFADAISALGRR